MAHLIFLGLHYQPMDLKWSVVNTTDFDRVYNYLTPESVIFIDSEMLKDHLNYKRLLMIKLNSPQVQLFAVNNEIDYNYLVSIKDNEIPQKIEEATSRPYLFTDKRNFIKDISRIILD